MSRWWGDLFAVFTMPRGIFMSPPSPPPVMSPSEVNEVAREVARDKVLLGNQARRLLDDPVLQLAFQDAEAEALRRWKDVKGTPETRERAFHMHIAIQEVRARLHSYLGNVKLFEAEQKRQEKA